MVQVFVFVAVIVVAVLALAWIGHRRLIYFPDTNTPSLDRAGLARAEAVTFTTADGLRLSAWFVAGSGSPPRPTFVVFNGNAGHRGYRATLAAALQRHGFNVLLTDYRGFGGNPGSPDEEGLAADADAARAYVLGPSIRRVSSTSANRSAPRSRCVSRSSIRRRPSSCDRHSHRSRLSASITIRCCQ
jgi:fermentation-respiration switch protein FrsA (DUF1100 family)